MVNCCPKPRLPRSAPVEKLGWVWMESTPGCKAARSVQLRPFKGSSRTVVALTVALMSELVSWTVGASVVTSTLFVTEPTCKAMLKTGCDPTLMVIPFLMPVLKPEAETATSYSPGSKFAAEYKPSVFVVTVVETPVAEFLITTWALATAAPEGSVIEPDSVPPATCASAPREFAKKSPKMNMKSTILTRVDLICSHSPFLLLRK